MFKLMGLFLKKINESLAETGSLDTGNEKDFQREERKAQSCQETFINPGRLQRLPIIIIFYKLINWSGGKQGLESWKYLFMCGIVISFTI